MIQNYPNSSYICVYLLLCQTFCFQIQNCSPLYLLLQQNPQPNVWPKGSFLLLVSKHHRIVHLAVCIFHSNIFKIYAPGTSRSTAEDDEELVFAASQCEAQLFAGVAHDTNENVIRIFCENTLSIFFYKK